MGFFFEDRAHKQVMVNEQDALPGRDQPMQISGINFVSGNTMVAPFPQGLEVAYFALGCFWGAERIFWKIDGVFSTAAGFQGGYTKNPTYSEVCTAKTGHAETVMVVFDPKIVSYENLVKSYFESHDPTQFMGQGNDIGTEYRDVIFPTSNEQYEIATRLAEIYDHEMITAGYGKVVTQVHELPTPAFYYAEEEHQQYLGKYPNGYCGIRGTGITCPIS